VAETSRSRMTLCRNIRTGSGILSVLALHIQEKSLMKLSNLKCSAREHSPAKLFDKSPCEFATGREVITAYC
jgi:hypothetical protein